MIELYNTLTHTKVPFTPLEPRQVRMYNCGPTVYNYPTIGNWRSFIFADVLRRSFEYLGLQVTQVMNLTDVGHMTMTEAEKVLSTNKEITDSETGIDRMEKAAKSEGKTVWEVAQYYIDDFMNGLTAFNILLPHHLPRATDYIQEQIAMIVQLEANGYVYATDEALYFDVTKFDRYGQLSGQKLEDKLTGARDEVNVDAGKKHPADFRLWQFGTEDRAMIWDSPWGRGFPGWHIECSAMSTALLGSPFDIHTGGVDHIPVHHENEIAQTEGALGHAMCNIWMHGEFLQIDGGRMGKSLGNAYTLQDLISRKVDPIALRYFFLNAHYRAKQNFTWEALEAAQTALGKLRKIVQELAEPAPGEISESHKTRFQRAIEDDINMPSALAIVWDVARDNSLSAAGKRATLLDFDRVLGLNLAESPKEKAMSDEVVAEIEAIVKERDSARANKDWAKSDALRDQLKAEYHVVLEDTVDGTKWSL